jgi:hypothetical protein
MFRTHIAGEVPVQKQTSVYKNSGNKNYYNARPETHYNFNRSYNIIEEIRKKKYFASISYRSKISNRQLGLQKMTTANQTVKQRLEESKNGNSSDTKESKKSNDRWKAKMTLRR